MKLFKIDEGMTVEGSTLQERQEIWKMLFDLNLIGYQCDSLDDEIEYIGNLSFYNDPIANAFLVDVSKGIPIKNIPFSEFKERLLTLKK